jgi:hypothetical protein
VTVPVLWVSTSEDSLAGGVSRVTVDPDLTGSDADLQVDVSGEAGH